MEPGISPFHVKGIIYRGTRAFFEAQGPGAYDRLVGAIDDERLRTFFTQPFLSASWYDVLPVAPLIQIEAKVMGLDLVEYLKQRTTFQADRDISGIYEFLLRLASPGMVAARLSRLLTQLFDFGSSSGQALGERHWRYEFRGWPVALHDWYWTAFGVYARRALLLAGAKTIHFRLTSMADPGESKTIDRGVEVATLCAELWWT